MYTDSNVYRVLCVQKPRVENLEEGKNGYGMQDESKSRFPQRMLSICLLWKKVQKRVRRTGGLSVSSFKKNAVW